MKKTIKLLAIFMVSCFVMVGCSNSNDSLENLNSLEKVQENKELLIGLNDTYPPMEFRDESHNLVGFDIDLGNEIAKKLGVQAKFVANDWKGIIPSLKSSKYDMILSTMTITEERKKEIDFSQPYLVGGQKIVVKSDNNSIKNVDDLKNKVVGVQLGTTGDIAAQKIEGIKDIKKYEGVTEAFNDLSIGRLDAVITDDQVGRYYLKETGENLVVLDAKLSEENVGIGFRKDELELKNEVQKAINELIEDGVMSQLSEKWFGYDFYK